MRRVWRTDKQDHNFTSTVLHLLTQNCYYILTTTKQLIKLKIWELLTIVLGHEKNKAVIYRYLMDMWFIHLGLNKSHIPSLPKNNPYTHTNTYIDNIINCRHFKSKMKIQFRLDFLLDIVLQS